MIAADITSKTFLTIENLLFVYGDKIFDKTSTIFLELFMIFYGCKFAWDMSYKILFKHKIEPEDIVKPLLIMSCLTVFMSSSHYVEEWIVRPAYNLAIGLTTITAALTGKLSGNATIIDMLNLVDQRLNEVIFVPCRAIAKNAGFLEYFLKWGIYFIEAIYIFVWILFITLLLMSVFRFITFYAISPLIIVSLFFPQTKLIGIAGFKSLLHGILGMLMAGIAMGLTVSIISDTPDLFYDNTGNMKTNWVFGSEYFTLLLLGLISIAFHLKSAKVSANLANIDDGAGPEAAVAGLGTMAVMSGKTALGRMGGKLAGRSARGAGRGASSLGRYGYDKFKNGKGAASLIEHMTVRVS